MGVCSDVANPEEGPRPQPLNLRPSPPAATSRAETEPGGRRLQNLVSAGPPALHSCNPYRTLPDVIADLNTESQDVQDGRRGIVSATATATCAVRWVDLVALPL